MTLGLAHKETFFAHKASWLRGNIGAPYPQGGKAVHLDQMIK